MKKIASIALALAIGASCAVSADKLDDVGLINDGSPGYETVKTNCVVCHSAKLVTQNQMTADSWLDSVRWMQATQGLWSFCDNEGWTVEKINAEKPKKPVCETEKNMIAYLAKNYSPVKDQISRRSNLPASELPPAPQSGH